MPFPLYITSPSNIHYLTGFRGTSGVVLKTSKKIYLFTDKRYLAEAEKLNPNKHLELVDLSDDFAEPFLKLLQLNKINHLGFEEKNLTYYQFKKIKKIVRAKKIKLIPAADLIENLRAIKSEKEIAQIKCAQAITEKTFAEIKKHLKPNIKETEICWKIEQIGRDLGAEAVSFNPLVCFGKNSAVPHHESNHTTLKKGNLILLDFGFKYEGYCSDMSRTLFTQSPAPLQEKIYQTVLKAQNTAIEKIKPKITGIKADSFARNIIKLAGFGDQFTHSLGHGIGLDIHEIPNLSPKFKKKPPVILKKNMVVTVEPGIYLEGQFGIRIEDMIVIKTNKNINLTSTDKTLEKSIIRL